MSSEVSVVYTNALFSLAREQGDAALQETRADLRQCAVLVSLNPELVQLLSLPTVSVSERQDIAARIFGQDGLVTRLIRLLIDHGRVRYLSEIADEFDAQMLDYQNTVDVTVTTAVPLSEEQQSRLNDALCRKLGKTVRITERIDREILGGVVVQYGDTRIDNSVKYRLETLKAQLR